MSAIDEKILLDQVRANGNWVEEVENGLTLDGHFQLADLRKLVTVLEARMAPESGVLSLSIDFKQSDIDAFMAAVEKMPKYAVYLPLIESPKPQSIRLPISKETFAELYGSIEHGQFNKACEQHLRKTGNEPQPRDIFSLSNSGSGAFFLTVDRA